MRTFSIHPTIHFGSHSLDRLKEISYNRIMVITDPFVVSSGMINRVTERLKSVNKDCYVFSDVVPDAPIEKIQLGVEEFLKYRPDCVVSIGGGSAIDSAKAIRECARRADNYGYVGLIAIPTTSGTGSEVTSFAVVNDTTAGKKYPLVSDNLLADEAILDTELVKSVPASITADTGMDVITHAFEAYVSNKHDEFSSALAEKAVEISGQFLLRSYYDNNDTHARQKMHIASTMAGLAFNAVSLGINHSIAHQLGGMFHIPHGRANAMLLPHVIEFNSDITLKSRSQKEYLPSVERYTRLAHLLGLSSNNQVMGVRSLISWTQFMMHEMNMPQHISEIKGINAVDYFKASDIIAENALNDPCTLTNPREVTKDDIKAILAKLW
ncbi:MAG: 1-propanol dehydrogenase PduQ [Lachnospiraceae bacterium]|jgi:1-propanol dehydrogenase